jgi:hypothetical protein
MPDPIVELNYGPVKQRITVGGHEGHDLQVLVMVNGQMRFSHVCHLRGGHTLRIAPLLQLEAGHRVEQMDPLTISPSILCEDCGLHGFVREGSWTSA